LVGILSKCDDKEDYFDRDCNLAIYCFKTIENLISYSSHDKQQKLLELLVLYVLKLNQVNARDNIQDSIKVELESHYTHLIRVIVLKLITPLELEDTKNIYNIIVQIFLRRGIFNEGLLALSAIATSKAI
jgi:hypothetical protein